MTTIGPSTREPAAGAPTTPATSLGSMIDAAPSRELFVRPRTVLMVIGLALGASLVLVLVREAWQVLTWILIAVFLAIALDPAVSALERRGMRRGLAVTLVMMLALLVFALIAALVVPPLVDQVTDLIQALPGALDDLGRGDGPFARLEREYHVAERLKEELEGRGAGGVLGFTSPALAVLRGVLTGIAATVTFFFLTLFMLLDGRRWVRGFLDLVPHGGRAVWERILEGTARTVGGYVTGNLIISLIAGIAATGVMLALGVPYAVPLGLLVAILDLIPLVGATVAAVVVCGVGYASEGLVPFLVLLVFFILYQQLENHLLQPLVYGRTVKLSPLAVAIAVLIGAEVAGVIGAVMGIPVGASLQVVGRELIALRRARTVALPGGVDEEVVAHPEREAV